MLISEIGASDSNSYAAIAEADNYFIQRGGADWLALSDDQKSVAIIKATDYIEATYYQSWKGEKLTEAQALAWPREQVVLDEFEVFENVIPPQLKKAVFEMAVRSIDGDLISDQGQRVIEEKVDVLTVKYYEHADPATRYDFVNRILAPLLRSAGNGSFQSVGLNRV